MDRARAEARAVGGNEGWEVGSRVGCNSHAEDKDEHVQPDGEVGEPAEALQSSDLANDHTSGHEDDEADDEAKAASAIWTSRDLRDGLAIAENENSHGKEQLDGLQRVDEVARPGPEDTEESIGVRLHREPVGIEEEKDLVELKAGAIAFVSEGQIIIQRVHILKSETTEDSVECYTGAVTHLSESPSRYQY